VSVETEVLWMPGGVRTEIHLDGAQTDGALCLVVDHPPQGWSLPPHRHLTEAETIHIIVGEFEIELEGEQAHLSAGQTIHIPRGAVRAGANVGAQPGRRLVVFSPAGIEGFFREVGAASPDAEPGGSAVAAVAMRYGWELVRGCVTGFDEQARR
jgi:quercetin dioxygenase-like cupin family protein